MPSDNQPAPDSSQLATTDLSQSVGKSTVLEIRCNCSSKREAIKPDTVKKRSSWQRFSSELQVTSWVVWLLSHLLGLHV